eukprot:Nitzschia sp. Nitz4//scaffold1_size375055//244277//245776//NITZ4_000297-RA/size375055-processed-gene-0.448-mRNA-1//-1//CDS//3329541108//5184//frame0
MASRHPGCPRCFLASLAVFLFFSLTVVEGFHVSVHNSPVTVARGGSISTKEVVPVYKSLAKFLHEYKFDHVPVDELAESLHHLASAQSTFKGIDGAAHEAYQRTHSGETLDTSVTGRTKRSAERLAATAQALLAAELLEIQEKPQIADPETLERYPVLLNITQTNSTIRMGKEKLSVLVLHDPSYHAGAGLDHGTIRSLMPAPNGIVPRGRLIVVVGTPSAKEDVVSILHVLAQEPRVVQLSQGLLTDEVASVQPTLYKAAGKLLETIDPILRQHNNAAIHFVGRSLAGGVASLAATMLHGAIPSPLPRNSTLRNKKQEERSNQTSISEIQPLSDVCRGRSSALTLGAPPCLSSNVLAAFCTSILYGDDVVCRSTPDTVQHLCDRVERYFERGPIGKNFGWVSDTISLTVSSLRSHAHGSEGEEAILTVAGQAYLLRPRRLGDTCSIHEVGNLKKGGREALRAQLLWQLKEVLLSSSMWKHHAPETYVQGLGMVRLRVH